VINNKDRIKAVYSFNMNKKIFSVFLFITLGLITQAQVQPLKQFLSLPHMKGASVSFIAKDIDNGDIVYDFDAERELIPASVLKLVTTATALEILGEDFRFKTSLEYDGTISNGTLNGNLYIKGSGDPTLGSSHFALDRNKYTPDQNTFIPQWLTSLKKAGIKHITGAVISDESIFDTEGTSLKWVYEDMGSYYGAGCYGISVFDNIFKFYVSSASAGSKPQILETIPSMPDIQFHNYLKAAPVRTDSSYVVGAPFSNDRFLYGIIPINKERFLMRGDIPDPPLFLAKYVSTTLEKEGISVKGNPTCYRLLMEENRWQKKERKILATTYSPTLREIVRIVNERSHNLYADALLKALSLLYEPKTNEVLSTTGKGVKVIQNHWKTKGMDISSLWMYDGSGLAITDKVTASFICDILLYMTQSDYADAFITSLPKAGMEGSVINFLKGSSLQGVALLKSGGMSRVRSYAGYIDKEGKRYAMAIFVNNYNGEGRVMIKDIEKLLLSLF